MCCVGDFPQDVCFNSLLTLLPHHSLLSPHPSLTNDHAFPTRWKYVIFVFYRGSQPEVILNLLGDFELGILRKDV